MEIIFWVLAYRIRRHNALRNYHALKLDNQNVKIERVNGHSNTRPGDIYHPDFDNGKPSFFDISVSNVLQPSTISTAVNAGAIAERREISKDNKQHSTVKTAGGSFFPLVVETLGLWTPFAIQTLRTIATRASLYNKKLAFKNLIGQLSVKLWAYNSKLVLDHFSFLWPIGPSL